MKKNILGVLLGLASIFNAQTVPSSTENYVFSTTCLTADCVKKAETIQYFDGLGRPKQVVNVKASPLGNDVVNHIEYDGFGRQTKDFLAIPQSASTDGAFYANPLSSVTSTPYGNEKIYSERVLESSPLDRIQQRIQVGTAWQNKPVSFGYQTNGDDEVYKYVTATSWSNNATLSVLTLAQATDTNSSNHCYKANQLYKDIVTDEDGNATIEFKNGQGQTLLVRKNDGIKNADTYYVYNEYNQLAYVIPPLAVGSLFPITTSPADNTFLNDLCYQYRYDGRGRLVEKKLPGKDWEYMVYDQQDRLVLTQDANLRLTTNNFKAKGWLFTKYDQFGRVVYTGFFPNGATRTSMQNALNSMQQNAANNEVRTTSPTVTLQGMPLYYNNQAFPTGNKTLLSVNYYDAYPSDVPSLTSLGFSQTFLSDNFQANSISTKTMPTASYLKNIEDDNWTKNYNFYDGKGRTVGMYSMNHLGGFTKTENFVDFTGVPQQTTTHHKRKAADNIVHIKERFLYNQYNGALEKHYHEVVGRSSEVLLADNEYNEIGQLKTKKVGNSIQEIDYSYNIRGWMTGINVDTSGNFQPGKLFNYRIGYNDPLGTLSTKPYAADQLLEIKEKYNGNIATVTWKYNDVPNTPEKKYGYVYDKLNRLRAGFYFQNTGSGFLFTEEHNELQKYDLNGNISELKRFSYKTGTAPYKIDDLEYSYVGNRVSKITDTYGDHNGYEGGGGTIGYDVNGNMTTMRDKGITDIKYNFLSLPYQMDLDEGGTVAISIKQVYRADGTKLRKTNTTSITGVNAITTVENTTDYIDGFHYLTSTKSSGETNGVSETEVAMEREAYLPEQKLPIPPVVAAGNPGLQFVPTAEGFYDFNENKYIYQYKDHLGNTRLSYAWNSTTSSIDVLDKNDYYPFGMNHLDPDAGSFFGQGSYKNYKYNGKELQETGMYDYGARMYMPDIGRWGVVDPLAEKALGWTPYRYGFNNPIKYTDPKGLFETKFGAWWHRTWNGGGDSKIKYDNRKKEYYYNRGDESKGNEVNFTAVYSNSKRSAGTPVFQVEGKATLGVQAGFRTPFGTAEGGIMTGDIGKVGWSSREKNSSGFYARYGDGKGHNYAGIGVGIDAAKLSVGGKADYVTNHWIPTAGDLLDYYPNNGDWDLEGNIGPKVNLGGIPNESLSPIIDSKIKQRLRGGTTEACSACIDVTGAMKLILGVEGRIRVGFTGQDD